MAAGPETSTPKGAKQVLGPDDVRRAITRMAHEIIERNHGTDRQTRKRAEHTAP